MKKKIKMRLKPILFSAGGALTGLAFYHFAGCAAGTCPLRSNVLIIMIYMGVAGWLLSGVFRKACDGQCNT